jgi:1,6-anhydro-N-acetylmuramate kinase
MVYETSLDPSTTPHINATPGHLVSAAINTFCKSHNIPNASIDLIGYRNRTGLLSSVSEQVQTRPEDCSSEEIIIAAETDITTVMNLSNLADRNGIGHGASIVALNAGVLLRHPTNFHECQDIGPISTLGFIPPECEEMTNKTTDMYFEIGNMFINAAMRYYTFGQLKQDNDGRWGARGIVNQCVVDRFLASKNTNNNWTSMCTGRETLADNEARLLIEECLFLGMSKYDTIATITRITARIMVKQYWDIMPKYLAANQKVNEIVVYGPGARNPNIITYIRSELSDTTIRTTGDLRTTGLSDLEEAVLLAQNALDTMLMTYAVVLETPETLQARAITPRIAPGRRWTQSVEQVMRFGGGKPLPTVRHVLVDNVSEVRLSLEAFRL